MGSRTTALDLIAIYEGDNKQHLKQSLDFDLFSSKQ